MVFLQINIYYFGYYDDHMTTSEISSVLERQLLLQLGDRLKRLRKSQRLNTVDMAARLGITRNTLRAVEAGDPATAIGTYLRAMSVLGVSGELALLAGDTLQPPPANTAAARSSRTAPVVQVRVTADESLHRLQDLQSLALHEAAVRIVKADPALVLRAKATAQRWLDAGESRSASLWHEWIDILDAGAWRKVVGRGRRAQQLRQASPIVTMLPEELRQGILAQVRRLKNGVEFGSQTPPSDESPNAKASS